MLPQSKKRVEEKPEEPVAYPVVQNYYYGYQQYYYKAPKPKLESSGDAHKIRLWFYVLLVSILWWLGIGFLPLLFFLPYLLIPNFSFFYVMNFTAVILVIFRLLKQA